MQLQQTTFFDQMREARQRQALIDSVKLEAYRKRLPASRAGRLLAVVRDLHLAEVKAMVKFRKGYDPAQDQERIAIVERLNDRIQKILQREDSGKQTKLF